MPPSQEWKQQKQKQFLEMYPGVEPDRSRAVIDKNVVSR